MLIYKEIDGQDSKQTFICLVPLKSWRPAATSEVITRPHNTRVALHPVCETFTMLCLNLPQETIVYFAMKKMKDQKSTNSD